MTARRFRFVAVAGACLALAAGCRALGFGDDGVVFEFTGHIEAGMFEQDVFVEKEPGLNRVWRIGEDEAAAYADAPIHRTTRPVPHAPFSPARTGPYPRGASLGMTLGDWLRAKGNGHYTCVNDTGRVVAFFKDLVPNGTYSMWYFRVAKAHMNCPDCPFSTIDFPLGAADGSQSPFIADARGYGEFDVSFKPCLAEGDDQLESALAVAYHSDGDTHGRSPGDMGSKTHVHLFAILPDRDGE